MFHEFEENGQIKSTYKTQLVKVNFEQKLLIINSLVTKKIGKKKKPR